MASEQVDGSRPAAPLMLGGRYERLEPLGRGGAAEVFLVRDRDGRRLAAKVLHVRHAENPEMRARFLREARTMAAIRHPNVVRVHEVVDADPPFLVMDYVAGGCVLDWMREHGALPARLAASLALDLCRALTAIHAAGVVHRDVKPHNLLVDLQGNCLLTDFGIAKIVEASRSMPPDEHKTDVGSVLGTDAFMAPEQRDDASSVDPRADLYAAGATLYTLCTRRAAVELYLLDADHEKLEAVHPALREIVLTACSRFPEDRFPSAAAFAAALEEVLPALPDAPAGGPSIVQPGTASRDPLIEDDEDTTFRRDRAGGPSEEGQVMSTQTEGPESRPTETIGAGAVIEETESRIPHVPGWAVGGAAAVLVAVVLGGAGVMSLQSGSYGVHTARVATEDARRVMLDTANRERMVIEALVRDGADRPTLEAAFFDLTDAPTDQRAEAASAFVDVLVTQAERAGTEDAKAAVAPLLQRRDDWAAAVDRWRAAASTPTGAAAVALGMAPAPPE